MTVAAQTPSGTTDTTGTPDTTGAAATPAAATPGTPTPNAVDATTTDPTSKVYSNLWQRIVAGYGLPPLDSPLVQAQEQWYADNPQYVDRLVDRARLYLYYIVQQVQKRGMPTEIALLPAIESAYRPHAYSRARAVGLWQFIPSTGRRWGLDDNWWYDGRRDVIAATNAALDYLDQLRQDFNGNWDLALAAYNAGEGRVLQAIQENQRRGLPTGYTDLPLRAETRNYVPKLIALSHIIADPAKFGITLAPIPNEPYFAKIKLNHQVDLRVVARLVDMSPEALYQINPGCKRWATGPDGPHYLLVPADKKDVVITALNNLPPQDRIRWARHLIRPGETLSYIARLYGVDVRAIEQTNHLRGAWIRAGRSLIIPLSSAAIPQPVEIARRSPPRPAGRVALIHKVRAGDTLWSIARRYNVYVNQIARWNLLSPHAVLRRGQRLTIWVPPDNAAASVAEYNVPNG